MGVYYTVLEADDTVIATGVFCTDALEMANEKPGRQLLNEDSLLVNYTSG